MKVARMNRRQVPKMVNAGGLGGNDAPAIVASLCDIIDVECTYLDVGDVLVWNGYVWSPQPATPPVTSIWVPVMTDDISSGLWYVAVTGDGDAVMTEVPL